ncbi:MAG: YbhB/YbcL family Raf kinase inhibitor-like protein [Tepidisphaeraceae bacterium]
MRTRTGAIMLTLLAVAGCESNLPSAKVEKAPSQMEAPATDEQLKRLLASNMLDARLNTPITVTSPAFKDGGDIPFENSDLGQKISPALKIEGVPPATRSIVIIVEDPDAPSPRPFDHWLLYDLPSTTTSLREGVPGLPILAGLGFAKQGVNSFGSTGYFGPHPPSDHGAHRYYFQVFAMDGLLDTVKPNAKKADLIAAMRGRVLAKGVLMGHFDNNTGR